MANQEIQLPEPGIFSEILSILFPVRCTHCGRGGNWLCPGCASQLISPGPFTCRRCGRPSPRETSSCPECRARGLGFARGRAAFCFQGPARSLVHRLKYSGQRRLAGFMAELSAPAAGDFIAGLPVSAAGGSSGSKSLTDNPRGVTLTYVPLHSSKLVSRGYNHAGMYAKALSRRLELPLRDLLFKRRLTVPQNRLDFDERRNNLIGSFNLRRGADAASERIILVDDVYTTGATVKECARILNEGLGVEVYVWTFARTVRTEALKTPLPVLSRNNKPAEGRK